MLTRVRQQGPTPPGSWPIIGHMRWDFSLFNIRAALIDRFSKWTATYGPYFCLHEGAHNVLVVSDPEMLRQIYTIRHANFPIRRVSFWCLDH